MKNDTKDGTLNSLQYMATRIRLLPDADFLTVVYSASREHDVTPNFLSIRHHPRDTQRPRYKLIVQTGKLKGEQE